MAGVLQIVAGDTSMTPVQVQENSVPMPITGTSITARVGTDPVTSIVADAVNSANGEAEFDFSAIPVGTFKIELVLANAGGSQTTEQFTLNVRSPL